jgi:hypothetical protein
MSVSVAMTMLLASTTAAVVATVFLAIVAPVFMAIFVTVTVPFLVAWGIFPLIPVVLNKIDTFVTGVVAMAMPSPIPGMAGWDAQVERWAVHRHRADHHRLRKEKRRGRKAANVEAAIEARLADID